MSGIEQSANTSYSLRPQNVGILALEVYFPKSFVDQDELETYDKVSKGKYTIGLGQKEMGFCFDNEDIHSLCLTVVSRLMKKHDISYNDIGRLEVGTETIIDKSKSVKTVLMKLFEESGNFDVEGVDTSNACYGGTSALFNALAWVESSSWDGRYAMVVCGDIAVYAKGSARCTGGAGSIAMLVGSQAPLVVEPGLRGSCMRHSYDFYKPDLTSEYPVVDGKLSVKSYITALDSCYNLYCQKAERKLGVKGAHFSLKNINYMLFHTPYCKLVQKSLARLALNDYLRHNTQYYGETDSKEFSNLEAFQSVSLSESVFDRNVERAFMASSKKMFDTKTYPSLLLAKRVGNMYTPSLYGCLASLLFSVPMKDLVGKRIGLFSYGSGLASSMFSIFVPEQNNHTTALANGSTNHFSLSRLVVGLGDIESRLESRVCVKPSNFAESLLRREGTHRHANYKPLATSDCLFPSTFYLLAVDENFKRTYDCTPSDDN